MIGGKHREHGEDKHMEKGKEKNRGVGGIGGELMASGGLRQLG